MDTNDPPVCERFLFCQGLLRAKPINMQTASEIAEGMEVNFLSIQRWIDAIVARETPVRICVIGSESGFMGSFDENYAEAKAKLHTYVENKKLFPYQQLVCVAPTIIGDAGMTVRRLDVERLEHRRTTHPFRRFLSSEEVAKFCRHLIYFGSPFVSNVVIRMNGGEHLHR